MSTLLLLTHQYPLARGDGCFVKNELPTLARYYTQVWLCPLQSGPATERLPLPANVRLLPGPRLNSKAAIFWHGLCNCAAIAPCWRLWRADRAHIYRPVHLKAFVLACLQGRALAASLTGCLKTLATDDVDVYAYWGAGAAYVLPWLARLPYRHYIRLHGFDLYEDRQHGYLPFRQPLYARAEHLVAISKHGRRHLQQQLPALGLPADKVLLNQLGTLPPPPRQRPDTDAHALNLVSCSNVIPVKRVERIYAMMADFARRHAPNTTIHWHHFGDGPSLPGLRAQIQHNCPPNLSVHLAGHANNATILDFYSHHNIDAFINLSTSEGIPVSIMEAISCGIPVLATDVGGNGEIVGANQRTGMLIAADSRTETAADALAKLLAQRCVYDPAAFWRTHHQAETQAHQLAQHCLQRPLRALDPSDFASEPTA